MTASKNILVTCATGKQGSAAIRALIADSSDITIFALTRNPASESAKALAQKSGNIKLVKGNLNDVESIFTSLTSLGPVDGVFSVQPAIHDGATIESEERQGKDLVDFSIKNGVKHFVYTSVDRHGDTATCVPHFTTKHKIEAYLLSKSEGTDMKWTILQPTFFMENFTRDFVGKVTFAMWHSYIKDKPLQLVATRDIGVFAAKALLQPDEYTCRKIGLAGDELTFAQANEVFRKHTHTNIPRTFDFVANIVGWMVKELAVMMRWFKDVGYGVDVAALKREYPELLSFGEWIDKESPWTKKSL